MISTQGILRARGSIIRQLSVMERQIDYLVDAEKNLATVRSKLTELNKAALITPTLPQNVIQTVALLNSYTFYDSLKANIIRDIDKGCGIMCGFLIPLIDICIENQDFLLKIWIKNRIIELDDIRRVHLTDRELCIPLPIASAMLIPYLEETRTGNQPGWFASVRNAIRKLLE